MATTWPLKYRALSFVITVAVLLGELAVMAIPLLLITFLAGVSTSRRFALATGAVALVWALGIASYRAFRPGQSSD